MRNLKTSLLIAALALSNAAFAVGSTSTGFGTATSSASASGTYASIVSFTIPTASLTIPSNQVRPGASFTVTIPVTNTTDRTITVTPSAVTGGASNVTVSTPLAHDIATGASFSFVYTVTFAADSAAGSALTGNVNLSFPLAGNDTAADPTDLSF